MSASSSAHAVAGEHVGRQDAERVQVPDGRAAVALADGGHFAVGLRQVEDQRGPVARGQRAGPGQELRRTQVGRVGLDRDRDPGVVPVGLQHPLGEGEARSSGP